MLLVPPVNCPDTGGGPIEGPGGGDTCATVIQPYYYHTDHLGTPWYMTSQSKSIVWRGEYFPFGELYSETVNQTNLHRLPGQYKETNTLYYNWNRWYDPKIGRYYQSDPIEIAAGTNLYAYVLNNPTNYLDIFGLDGIYISYRGYPVNTGWGFDLPLGHSAVISINPSTGFTRYYEYGRYGNEFGRVRRQWLPNLELDSDGKPKKKSLEDLYEYVSKNYGKNRIVDATYYKDADYKLINEYAEKLRKDPNREEYKLLSNSCKTFARKAIEAGRKK